MNKWLYLLLKSNGSVLTEPLFFEMLLTYILLYHYIYKRFYTLFIDYSLTCIYTKI